MGELTAAILKALSEPFEPNRIEWKPQKVTGDKRRALAVAYIDARDVMERLDSTVGGGWEFRWEPVGDDVQGRLTVCGVTREDVGEQGDGSFGATRKAAVSDALKRCGVQFGVGRYLYDLPAAWVDYDERTKSIINPPALPDWAMPRNGGAPRPTPVTQRTPSRGGYVDTEELQGGGDPGDLYGTESDPALLPDSLSAPDRRRWDAMVKAGIDPRTQFGEQAEAEDAEPIQAAPSTASGTPQGAPVSEEMLRIIRQVRADVERKNAEGWHSKNLKGYQGVVTSTLNASLLKDIANGDEDAANYYRHMILAWLVDKDSSEDLTDAECWAIQRWAQEWDSTTRTSSLTEDRISEINRVAEVLERQGQERRGATQESLPLDTEEDEHIGF